MSGPSGEQRQTIVRRILASVDPRSRSAVTAGLTGRAHPEHLDPPRPEQQVVIAGHRAAGKSRLLPLFGALTGRPTVDLDRWVEGHHRRSIREWLRADSDGFRQAEREGFQAQPPGTLISVGGGFLALHPDLLTEAWVVLVPVRFETYRERLMLDRTRPRLRPELSLEEELRVVFESREQLHARVATIPLGQALRVLG